MNNLLIVTNYQNKYLTGSSSNPLAKLIEQEIVKKVEDYLAEDKWVVFSYVDSNEPDAENWETENPDSLKKLLQEHDDDIIQLRTGSDDLVKLLSAFKPWSTIEVCGIYAENGIITNVNTVLSAIGESESKKILVDCNAIAGSSNETKSKAIDILKSMNICVYVEVKTEESLFANEEASNELSEI